MPRSATTFGVSFDPPVVWAAMPFLGSALFWLGVLADCWPGWPGSWPGSAPGSLPGWGLVAWAIAWAAWARALAAWALAWALPCIACCWAMAASWAACAAWAVACCGVAAWPCWPWPG